MTIRNTKEGRRQERKEEGRHEAPASGWAASGGTCDGRRWDGRGEEDAPGRAACRAGRRFVPLSRLQQGQRLWDITVRGEPVTVVKWPVDLSSLSLHLNLLGAHMAPLSYFCHMPPSGLLASNLHSHIITTTSFCQPLPPSRTWHVANMRQFCLWRAYLAGRQRRLGGVKHVVGAVGAEDDHGRTRYLPPASSVLIKVLWRTGGGGGFALS